MKIVTVLYGTPAFCGKGTIALPAPTSCPAHLPKAEGGHRVVSSRDDLVQRS